MVEESDEQRPVVVGYEPPQKRRQSNPIAFAAFIASMISCVAIPAANSNILSQRVVVVGAITALAAGLIGLRVARRQAGVGRPHAWMAIIISGGIASVVLWGVVNDRLYGNVRERQNRVYCQSNISKIGQGFQLYANDHAGQLPQRFDQLISEADLNPAVFICPSTDDDYAAGPTIQQILADFQKPGHCSYIYVGAGMSTSTITKDSVLAYEPVEHHEGRGAHFVFGDFGAEWRNAKEARKMIEQLKKGVNPPQQ
jgi:hypothetical protein